MDERAFARVAEEYAGRLYSVAYRMLGNRADAEDAVQRALLKCFAARTSYSPQWAVSTWLYRALTNVCIDELRRRRVRADDTDPGREAGSGVRSRAKRGGIEPVASTPPTPIAQRVDLTRALDIVPREARMLLALHYVDGLGYRELAEIRGISVNTVKSQLARGKAILKQALQAGGHDGSD
ncbi:MAG TPA: sigma-70 family RNA polymerase sigma factor [Candidatus Acidoferrum sp.]|jgi:RNA polymerase sigma-70 factor (ECF subfamily)|nr:sigma-70 family RNA polymerase sigma factor [Candidatus Acidoferrum sp.]